MTVKKLIEKFLSFRGDTKIVFTFYCNETNKTYIINLDNALTVYDAYEDQVEFYNSDTPQKRKDSHDN